MKTVIAVGRVTPEGITMSNEVESLRARLAAVEAELELRLRESDSRSYAASMNAVRAAKAETALRRIRSIGATSGTRPGTAMNDIFDVIDAVLLGDKPGAPKTKEETNDGN